MTTHTSAQRALAHLLDGWQGGKGMGKLERYDSAIRRAIRRMQRAELNRMRARIDADIGEGLHMEAPPLETINRMRVFFATGELSCTCAYCDRSLEWREIALQAYPSNGKPFLVVCAPCGADRALQPDCELDVLPGCAQMHRDSKRVSELAGLLGIRSHAWCGNVSCHLCYQDLRCAP